MKKTNTLSEKAFQLAGKMPLKQAIPLGLQHVLAMFCGSAAPHGLRCGRVPPTEGF